MHIDKEIKINSRTCNHPYSSNKVRHKNDTELYLNHMPSLTALLI